MGNGRLTPLRLFNVFLGMATLIVAYQVARRLLPAWQALTAVAFIAFVPQHMAISASVNNDGLSELLIALLLWGALAYRADGKRPCLLGLLVRAALLTKVTAYLMARWWGWPFCGTIGGLADGVAARHGRLSARPRPWPALVGRNLVIYGWPTFGHLST
ncbi:MAG: glycosyltransferase family 39 protein [Chloroflexi bacterium]|nr:glycosyltransferase family 39 protein [Chloroflexota bacterium]